MAVFVPPGAEEHRQPETPLERPDELAALIEEARRRARRRRATYTLALLAGVVAVGGGLHAVLGGAKVASRVHVAPRVAAPPRCRASQLKLTLASTEEFMFHYGNIYALTNIGASRCTLGGHPRVAAVGPRGRIPVVVHYVNDVPFGMPWHLRKEVMLRPGARAALVIGYVGNPDAPPCQATPTSFEITFPGATYPLTTRQSVFSVCPRPRLGRDLYVSPILPFPKWLAKACEGCRNSPIRNSRPAGRRRTRAPSPRR